MESVLQRSTYPVYEREKEVPYEGAGLLGVGGCSYVEKVVKKDGSEGAWVRKVIEVSTGDEAAQLQRIEEEVKAIRESTHPHVVEYVDSYRFLSSFNIIIAPVAECTLEGYLTHTDNFEPILDPNRRVLLEQWPGCLLQAVRYLHDQNIRHTDIKPCNILIHHGNILISDFGISKNSTGLDTTGSYGTPGLRTKKYCAPETFSESGSRRGRAEDIFLSVASSSKSPPSSSASHYKSSSPLGATSPRSSCTQKIRRGCFAGSTSYGPNGAVPWGQRTCSTLQSQSVTSLSSC